jgi:hypothetical protein
MTEQELRALVREAIARHVGGSADRSGAFRLPAEGTRVAPSGTLLVDPAHAMFRLARADGDTACIIEPSVACNHCGYCKSYGH